MHSLRTALHILHLLPPELELDLEYSLLQLSANLAFQFIELIHACHQAADNTLINYRQIEVPHSHQSYSCPFKLE